MKIPKIKRIKRIKKRNIAKVNTGSRKRPMPKQLRMTVNEEWHAPEGGFAKGNPGRPKGSVNKRTQFINALMEAFGPKEIQVFKRFFKNPNYKFLSALDRVVAVAGIGGKGNQVDPESLPPFQVIIEGDNEPATKT